MNNVVITSHHNEKIKKIIKLKKSSERKSSKLFLIDGHKEIQSAIRSGVKIEKIYFCRSFFRGKDLRFRRISNKLVEVDEKAFKKISYPQNPDGYMAVAKFFDLHISNIALNKNPIIIILESVEKPGNLGAILRTADASGVDGVIITDPTVDVFNPNVIRASRGTVFTNQVAVGTKEEVVGWLAKRNINIFVTTPSAKKNYINSNYKKSCALVFGTEHSGLSDFWINSAFEKIKINMLGKIDSLNVSVSVAIIIFEALRQRTKQQP